MGDGSTYYRIYSHIQNKLMLPNPLLIGFDAIKGTVESNFTMGPNFYSLTRESSSGDLVGLGSAARRTRRAARRSAIGPAASRSSSRTERARPTARQAHSAAGTRTPPLGRVLHGLPGPRAPTRVGMCRRRPAAQPSLAAPHQHGADMKQTVVKTYNSTELGGIAGSLLAGGALSADGILSHPVVSARWSPPTRTTRPRVPRHRHERPQSGPGMHTGFISIDVKTGELLHAHKVSPSAPSSATSERVAANLNN